MFSCAGLDCEIRAPFFVLGMPHTDPTANELSLTQILQISLNFSFDGVKSHGGWQIGRGACRSTLSTHEYSECSEYSDFQSPHKLFLLNLVESV